MSTPTHTKAVEQCDPKTGIVIRSFRSQSEATRELNLSSGNISSVCHGKRDFAGGYFWRFKGSDRKPPTGASKEGPVVRRSQPIQQVDPVTGEVVNVFSSPFHAERVLKIRGVARQIGAVCGPYVPPEMLALEAAARHRLAAASTTNQAAAAAGVGAAAVARANIGGASDASHQTAADLRRGKLVQGYRWRYHMPEGSSSASTAAAAAAATTTAFMRAKTASAPRAGAGAGAARTTNINSNNTSSGSPLASVVARGPALHAAGGGGLRTHIAAPVEGGRSAAASGATTKRRKSSSSSSSSSSPSPSFHTPSPSSSPSSSSSSPTSAAFSSSAMDGGTVRGRRAMAPPAPSSGIVAQPTVGAGGTLQLYCLCKSHDGDGRLFVRCEACQDYFHPTCVGVTDEAMKIKKRFCCPDCRKSRRAKSRKAEWTPEEDALVHDLVESVGTKSWAAIARSIPGRTGKQCRERWVNQLDPAISKDSWTAEEEETLVNAHAVLDNRWAEIALHLPGRSENTIKNYWNQMRRREAKTSAVSSTPASPAAAFVGAVAASPAAAAMQVDAAAIPDERDAVALLLGLTRKSSSPPSSLASSPVATARVPFPRAVAALAPVSRGPSPVPMSPVLVSSINIATPTPQLTLTPDAIPVAVVAAAAAAAAAAVGSTRGTAPIAAPATSIGNGSSLAHSASALVFAQANAHAEMTRALAEAQVHFQMLVMAKAEAQDRAQGLDEQSASVFQLAACQAALQMQQQAAPSVVAAPSPQQVQAQIALQYALQQQSAAAAASVAAEAAAAAARASVPVSPTHALLRAQDAHLISSVVSAADQFASTTAAVPFSAAKRPFSEDSFGPRAEPGAKRSRSESSETGGFAILGQGDSTPMVSASFDLDATTTGSPAAGKQQTPPRMPTESSKKRLFPSPAAATASVAN